MSKVEQAGIRRPHMHDKTSHLLNEMEVASLLTVSVATIRRWRLLGQGVRYMKVGSAVRYRPEDVTAWLNSRPTGGDKQSGTVLAKR